MPPAPKAKRPGQSVVQTRLSDSDDELDGISPHAGIASGANAYEALLGHFETALAHKSAGSKLASKVKSRNGLPKGAQQQTPLDDAKQSSVTNLHHAASSSAGDGGGAEASEAAHEADDADHSTADFYHQHFDRSSADTEISQTANAPATWKEDTNARSAWPNTTWSTTGAALPKV